mmetsp:Transcript_23378/g.33523  ORF Transcript_23378/g.33523 Transcript_23378/m.33523 type:complete len:318 (-) Transcript_23378:443-1396(-)
MNPAHDNRLNLDAYDMEAHETMPLVKRKLSRGLSTISHHHQEDGISKTNGADMAHSTKMALYYAAINGLCFGVLAVWAYSYQFENWTIIDSLYFAVCTFTTVGYGDLSPSSESSRIFTCFFAVYGIAILGFFINIIGARLVTLHQEAINDAERLNTMKAANMFDEDDNTQSNGIMEKKKLLEENERDTQRLAHYSAFYVIIKALVGQLPIILIVLGVAVLMGKMEGWSVANGIYFGVVTASTVGYGDVTPVTTHMKAVAIVILPMMVAVFCEVLGCVAGAYLKVSYRLTRTIALTLGVPPDSHSRYNSYFCSTSSSK